MSTTRKHPQTPAPFILRLLASLLLLSTLAFVPACGGGNTGPGDGGGKDGSGGSDKVVGNCNGDCKDTEECVDGQFCLPKCGADESRCGSACKNTQSDKEHCGACDKKCADGESCNAGKCEAGKSCADSETKCGDACVDTKTSTDHCGACDAKCASGETCKDGKCEAAGCPSGQEKCGESCVDTNSNKDHCGKCDNKCGTDQRCDSGECKCQGSQTKCGDACVDTDSSAEHCGVCDNKCGTNQYCDVGKCTCPNGQELCGGACVDVSSSDDHCGKCDNKCTSPQYCDVGACICPNNQTACGTSCVDTQTSNDHCGACDTKCTTPQTCNAGTCACPSGQTACGTSCVDVNSSTDHCGACNNKCATGESCDSGSCVKSCTAPEKSCDGKCVNTDTSTDHCGGCSQNCATGETCESGSCKNPCTTAGETSCNGSCVNTQTDNDNCGQCGTKCDASNNETCTSGSCVQKVICQNAGETACSGVCVNLQTDKNNCGTCGTACAATETCDSGSCTACNTPSKVCVGACVNTNTNPNHCGDCGKACALTETCNSGTCGTCNGTICSGVCADTNTDVKNCGSCANACATGETCESGTCTTCSGSICNGSCIDTQNDNNNCGQCGTKCAATETCESGTCKAPTCTSPEQNCGGTCTNTQTDDKNCGQCAKACAAGEACQSGSCVASCAAPKKVCSGVCSDLTSDAKHCGACGTACATGEVCNNSKCVKTWVAVVTGPKWTNTQDMAIDTKGNLYATGVRNDANGFATFLLSKVDNTGKVTDLSQGTEKYNGFMADLTADQSVTNTNWMILKGWTVSGTAGLHNVGGAFNATTGEYTAPADGYYLFSARLRFDDAETATNQIEGVLAIDGKHTNNNGTFARLRDPQKSDHIVVEGLLKLTKGQKVALRVRSTTDNSYKISSESGLSGYFIGSDLPQGLLVNLTASQNVTNTNWTIVKGWKTSSTTDGEKHLFVNGGGFNGSTGEYTVPSNGYYYLSARVAIAGANTAAAGEEVIAAIGVNGNTNIDQHGCFSRVTQNKSPRRSMFPSCILQLVKGDKLTVRVKSSDSAYNVLLNTGLLAFRMPGMLTSFAADSTSGLAIKATGWQPITTWRTGGVKGIYRQSNHFTLTSGEYRAPREGYYHFSAIAVINNANTGTNQTISLGLGINGVPTATSGAIVTVANPTAAHSLHVHGTFYLKTNDKVRLYANSSVDNDYLIGQASGFSGAFIRHTTPTVQTRAVATDSNDNVYVAANYFGTLDFANKPSVLFSRSIVAKRNANGTWENIRHYTNGYPRSIAVDSSGNIFMCGVYYSGWTYATGKSLTSPNTDAYILKTNNAGVVQWAVGTKTASNVTHEPLCAVASSGEIYIFGRFQGKAELGTITLNSAAATGTHRYLARVKADGSGFEWAKEIKPGVYPTGITTDGSGNVYLTGTFDKTVTIGSTNLLTSTRRQLFVLAFDKTGAVKWSQQSKVTTNVIRSGGIAFGNNTVYVSADYNGNVELGNIKLTTTGKYQVVVAGLDNTGKWIWARSAGGAEDDWFTKIVLDAAGNFYFSANFKSPTITFRAGTATKKATGNHNDSVITKNLP